MNPGVTQQPVASITDASAGASVAPGSSTATIRPPPSTTTCPGSITPDGVTTAPPAMTSGRALTSRSPVPRGEDGAEAPQGDVERREADATGEAGGGEHR